LMIVAGTENKKQCDGNNLFHCSWFLLTDDSLLVENK
jgi:hypothetical protein